MNKELTIVITGGGTGGHVFPAIAVAQVLKNDESVKRLVYIGNPDNMEKEAALVEKIEFFPVNISGMPRKCPFRLMLWLLKLFFAINRSLKHLSIIRPDVVFGTGGYVSGPVIIAASIMKIPYVIHDCDAHPGIVSRFAAKKASGVSVSFEKAKNYLKSNNIYLFGNPLRSGFNKISREDARIELGIDPEKKTLLVMGGSQGAKSINNAMIGAIRSLLENYDIQVIHQTGKKNFQDYIKDLCKIFPGYFEYKSYLVSPFFNNMECVYAAADLAVSRSGSLSISELNLNSLPSILIPYPYAAADHQKFNAIAIEDAGASIMLPDKECTSEKIIELITELIFNDKMLDLMKNANQALARPDAVNNIVNLIKNCAK